MVDDILVPVKCGIESINANSKVNTFVESKNLKLSKEKCHKMHIGQVKKTCPKLKVHQNIMSDSSEEKYLGDLIADNGKLDKTIEQRKAKGFGLV